MVETKPYWLAAIQDVVDNCMNEVLDDSMDRIREAVTTALSREFVKRGATVTMSQYDDAIKDEKHLVFDICINHTVAAKKW
jgi:hypothetical protein